MKNEYDIIVVGGGPAGSMTASYAAAEGAKVLLLEKKRDIGNPVRCAEGVGEAGLKEFFSPDPRWVLSETRSYRLIAPNMNRAVIKNKERGYVLNRKVFDYMLAEMAAHKGAEIMTGIYVTGIIADNGSVKGVTAEYLGKKFSIQSKIVIGADGVESRVGRWCGIKTNLPLRDIETCAQVTIVSKKIDKKYCDFYFGREVAPGGYAWVFPRDEHFANVGLGISGIYSKNRSPLQYLNKFIKRHFPDASILTSVAGGVPCAKPMKKIVMNGLMLAGDAAHQANPITGGGIVNAMKAGRIAGKVAADAVAQGDVSSRKLKEYADRWDDAVGEINRRSYNIKKVIFGLSDRSFNNLAEVFSGIPPDKITIREIFVKTLKKHPSLILDAIKVFS